MNTSDLFVRMGVVAVLGLGLAGCGTNVEFVPTNSPASAMSPKSPESVHIYTSGRPAQDYVEVGLLEAQQESEFSTHDRAEIMAELRTRAAELGCDAIVIAGANDKVVGQPNAFGGQVDTLEGYRATCIQYYPPGADPSVVASSK